MKKIISIAMLLMIFTTLFAQDITTPKNNYKSRIIKTSFFAPLFQHLEFGYEQGLNNKMVLDGSVGIIGPTISTINKPASGMYLKAGTKFFFNPDFVMDGQRRYNDFQGTYFEPQLMFSGFNYKFDDYVYNPNTGTSTQYAYTGKSNSWALMLNMGKQWVLANIVSLNIYGGIGYGGSTTTDTDPNHAGFSEFELHPYKYSHTFFSNDFPLALTDGITIGILLK